MKRDNFNCNYEKIRDIGINKINCHTKIGLFNSENGYKIILAMSSYGLFSNIIILLNFLYHLKKSNESSTKTTMRKLFMVLQILDCIQSIYWIYSSLNFQTAENIKNNAVGCTLLSFTYIFIINFEFLLMIFLLRNLRRISSNPIDGIFKPYKNLFKYLTISLCFGLGISLFSLLTNVIGRSPFITCFINTEEHFVENLIILSIPEILIFCIIWEIIYDLCKNKLFNSDVTVRKLYIRNSLYVLFSCFLYLPMITLMFLSLFKYYNSDKTLFYFREINNFITILTSSIPFIVNTIRIADGFTELKWCRKLIQRNPYSYFQAEKEFQNIFNKSNNKSSEDQFAWLESHSIKYFIRDIFIGIATSLKKSAEYGSSFDLQDIDINNSNEYIINFNNFCLNDETVKESEYLNVKIEEFCPKGFCFLRNLENIDIDEMIKQFLPKNNKKGIKESQGKSGSFFISTDDNKYLIKTLKATEFELIKNNFLFKYCEYLNKNPNSLLSRLYGMYSLSVNQGRDNILLIVMRNTIGDFQNNIMAKYDLKGSTFGRETKLKNENDKKTMKDNDFNDIEKKIFLEKKSSDKLRKICENDSKFLKDMELMDYSLFLVKLSLSKEDAEDIFGKNVMGNQNEASEQMLLEDNSDIDNNKKRVGERKKYNINYYEQYLYPSLNQGTAYILSIIDYLQLFNFFKFVESELKTKFRKNGKKIISCVEPEIYSKRFIGYINNITNLDESMNKNDLNLDNKVNNIIDNNIDNDNNKSANKIFIYSEENINNTSI